MRIEGFDLYRYDLALVGPVALRGATLDRREGALLRLTAEDGSEGWGEAAPLPGFSPESLEDATRSCSITSKRLAGRRVTDDFRRAEEIFSDLNHLTPSARFAVEVALLNLSASYRGGTAPYLLADRPRETVRLSGLLSGSEEKVLADAHRARREGYGAVKLKVGRREVSEDTELVRRVAGILGDAVSLRLDANRAWGFEEALRFAEGISGARVAYVEEPLADPGGLAGLVGEWGLPVALDETVVRMPPEGLARHPYARAVVLKPTLLGGISRALRLADAAMALGMAVVVSSSYEAGVGTAALVALAAALGGEPAGLDTYRALAEDVVRPPLPLPAPTVDVRGTTEAAGRVDVGGLERVCVR